MPTISSYLDKDLASGYASRVLRIGYARLFPDEPPQLALLVETRHGLAWYWNQNYALASGCISSVAA